MAFTGRRAGSLIRFTNRTRPVGPVGSSGPAASFVPHAAPTRANAAINPNDFIVIVRGLVNKCSQMGTSWAPADQQAHWDLRFDLQLRRATSSAVRQLEPQERRRG